MRMALQAGLFHLVAMAALFVLNAGFWAAVVRPRVREYTVLSAENNPRVQALRQKQTQVEALEGFVTGLQKAREDLRTLREDVLGRREERMIGAQVEIEEICKRFGIDLDMVTYDHLALGTEGLDVMRMTVPLEGGYADLRRFLQAVESSEKFLIVERVTLGQGKDGGVLLQLNVTLATYFYSPETPQHLQERRRA